jgi:hypothetical protein
MQDGVDLVGKVDKKPLIIHVVDGCRETLKQTPRSVCLVVACWEIEVKEWNPWGRQWWRHWDNFIRLEW